MAAASSATPVEKRRTHEFEFVGEGELAHQADRRDRHLRFREPGRLRDVDELIGNARRETEHQHRRNSPIGEGWLRKEGGLAPSAAVFCMWTPDPPLGLTLPCCIAYIES